MTVPDRDLLLLHGYLGDVGSQTSFAESESVEETAEAGLRFATKAATSEPSG